MGIQIVIPRRVKYWKPLVYAEMPGRNMGRHGPQLAGHKIAVTLPEDPAQFDPAEHIRDLGPLQKGEGTADAPFLVIPGFGEMEMGEIADLSAAIREKNEKRAKEGSKHQERLSRSPERFQQAFRDHIDRVLRARVGKRTFGPGTQPGR